MCGRYVRKGEAKKVAEVLGVRQGEEHWTESFNVAPMSSIPIVRSGPEAGRHLDLAVWGFPSLTQGRAPLFNARGETVHRLQSFREAFRLQRCIIPASGFYEWRPKDRQPFYFERGDGHPMAFAGIWQAGPSNHLHATVLTTTPNHEVKAIHGRMPVILEPASWEEWLSGTPLREEKRVALLSPSPDQTLACWPVGRGVGSVGNNSPGLLERTREEVCFTPELF
jgi:putative SOS response-associated peptidase YedK